MIEKLRELNQNQLSPTESGIGKIKENIYGQLTTTKPRYRFKSIEKQSWRLSKGFRQVWSFWVVKSINEPI
jgi:hypothetical protein